MKEAIDVKALVDLFNLYGCTVGMIKCEQSTKEWLRYLCKRAAAYIGC